MELADAVAGTPLAPRVAEAAEKAGAGTAGEDHFVALAAARTALPGSVHDALTARIEEAVDRPRTEDSAGVAVQGCLIPVGRGCVSTVLMALTTAASVVPCE